MADAPDISALSSMKNEAGYLRVAKNSREACLIIQELLDCTYTKAREIHNRWANAGDNITERLIELAIETDEEDI